MRRVSQSVEDQDQDWRFVQLSFDLAAMLCLPARFHCSLNTTWSRSLHVPRSAPVLPRQRARLATTCQCRGMTAEQPARITNYNDFWLHYLREHSLPQTRAIHCIGTSTGILIWLYSLYTMSAKLAPLGLVVGQFPQNFILVAVHGSRSTSWLS